MNRENAIRELEERYRQAGSCFNELQRRLWAAQEAVRLGRGGIAIVSQALRISPNTIKRGIQELCDASNSPPDSNQRIRKPGGGRKSNKAAASQGVDHERQ